MSLNEIKEQQNLSNFLDELSDPEVQDSIITLIRKLPKIKEAVLVAEQGIEFATAVVSDQESIKGLFERAEGQLSQYNIDKESLNALLTLLEKLPKLVKIVSALEQITDFIEDFSKDRDSQQYLLSGVRDLVDPVTTQVQNGISLIQEAKERADRSQEPVSIFQVFKLLKDPTVQKAFRYMQAFLVILSEKNPKKS